MILLCVFVDSSFISFYYFGDPDLCTIEIHQGGQFKKSKYVGGSVHWVDNCIANHLSMLDIYDQAISLVYDHLKAQYHYRIETRGYVLIK